MPQEHPTGYSLAREEWQSEDHIELELPEKVKLQAVDSVHPDIVAITCGLLVLMAVTEEYPWAASSGRRHQCWTVKVALKLALQCPPFAESGWAPDEPRPG